MNDKETAIVELIRENPYLSQQEMADQLNMSRPALANLISGLTKRGIITGRAYILSRDNEIVCIGGANVDRKFHLNEGAQLGTSNPATMTVSVGGVARNIGENLGRLGSTIRLLTVAGNDADWQLIQQQSAVHMDVTAVGLLPGESTGSYSAVLSPDGELVVAMANMEVYESLSIAYIEAHERLIANATLAVIDLNCPKETVEYVKERALFHGTGLVIVPVSSPKMVRMPDNLEGVTWFICNQDEAETYTGIAIQNDEDWQLAVQGLLDVGAQNVAVTAGARGVMAGNTEGDILRFPAIQRATVEDVTGAGDAFVSGVLYGHLEGMDTREAIQRGLVNASKTLGSSYTVRPELSKAQIEIEMEEF
ncbi:sugar/nucleoside kinase (ribokinase family) [Filibacter limicola]|uniref:Sugar/nucleoside kinase (Ribokinase family) n=1 Tax=Sporosarcina limicola TaxID=34101 RepID=A0A927RC65_9BACL|nr:PfkB family carbohydrate kinase [Sporosarcina limicola]MBE1554040.1 sugar/nucleoside kinase (ribokinase family) [Sporosarcina limicola]